MWAYDRCGGGLDGGCDTNLVDPIVKYDRNTGELLTSFGAGVFVTPHGLHVDSEGNVWVTDFGGNEAGTKGHQVIKFSPEGEILMRLGTAGVPGSGPDHFNQPCDVITAPNGDIFVADGHSGQNENPPPGSTGRIIKFTAEGEYIMEWGQIGNGQGEFRTPHALEFDSQGRLFVADRGNHRIQIFDQEGNYIDSYYQYSRISGLSPTMTCSTRSTPKRGRRTTPVGLQGSGLEARWKIGSPGSFLRTPQTRGLGAWSARA